MPTPRLYACLSHTAGATADALSLALYNLMTSSLLLSTGRVALNDPDKKIHSISCLNAPCATVTNPSYLPLLCDCHPLKQWFLLLEHTGMVPSQKDRYVMGLASLLKQLVPHDACLLHQVAIGRQLRPLHLHDV